MVAWVAGGRATGAEGWAGGAPQSAGPVTCRGRSPEARAAAGGECGTAGGVAPRREERGDHELRVRRRGALWPARAASRRGRPHAGQETGGRASQGRRRGGVGCREDRQGRDGDRARQCPVQCARMQGEQVSGEPGKAPQDGRRPAGARQLPPGQARPARKAPAGSGKSRAGTYRSSRRQRAAVGGGRRRARNGRARQASWLPRYLGKDQPAREAAPAKPGTGAEFGE